MSGRFCFWSVPILLLFLAQAVIVHRYGVDIPYHDEFITPGHLLFEMTRGHFVWQNLWVQHNDARLLVPKLLWVLQAFSVGWSIKFWMYVSVALAALESWLLCKFLSGEGAVTSVHRWLYAGFFGLLLLHPANAPGTFLRGSQYIAVVPAVLLVAGHYLYSKPFELRSKLIIYFCLSALGTFTFSNGLALWLLLFPFPQVIASWRAALAAEKKRIAWSAAFAALAGLVIVLCYFIGYRPYRPHGLSGDPQKLVPFFFSWVGAPLAIRFGLGEVNVLGIIIAIISGAILLVLGILIWRSRNYQPLTKAWPWLMLILYGCVSGFAVALGRASMPGNEAQAGRYFLISLQLTIGVCGLLLFLLQAGADGERQRPKVALLRTLAVFILICGIVPNLWAWGEGMKQCHAHYLRMLNYEYTLSLWREAPDISPLPGFRVPVPPDLRVRYLALVDAGVIRDLSPRAWLTDALARARHAKPAGKVKLSGSGKGLRAEGSAIHPTYKTPFPAVITALVERDGSVAPVAVNLTKTLSGRPIQRVDRSPFNFGFNFRPFGSAPKQYSSLEDVVFFAIDLGRHEAYPLVVEH